MLVTITQQPGRAPVTDLKRQDPSPPAARRTPAARQPHSGPPDAAALGGAAAAAAGPACPAASDGLAPLFELAEHPVRNMPPPSRTLPIMRPATTPCLLFPGVFRMPL